MYFPISDTSILRMNFWVKKAKGIFTWTTVFFCCKYATILLAELKFIFQKIESQKFPRFKFTLNFQHLKRDTIFELGPKT